MNKKVKVTVVDTEEVYDIPVHETYRFLDIKVMIQEKLNPAFPEFLLFPKDFQNEKFNIKREIRVIDLTKAKMFFVNYRENQVTLNNNLLEYILREYESDSFVVYEKLLVLTFYYAMKIFGLFSSNRSTRLPGGKIKKTNVKKTAILKNFYLSFANADISRRVDAINKYVKGRRNTAESEREKIVLMAYLDSCKPIITLFAKKLRRDVKSRQYIFEKAVSFAYQNERAVEILQTKAQKIQETEKTFQGLKELSVQPLEENGKILILEIMTKQYSAGTLFDQLELNDEFFQATYKGFHKIYGEHSIEAVDTKGNDVCILRHEKRYIRKFTPEINENVQIYIKNIANGMEIQVLLLKSSSIATTEALFRFLHMDEANFRIRHIHTKGIIGSCLIKNSKPVYLRETDAWSAFEPSILADCIMNTEIFRHFLTVNDSEKISRETPSSYIYFHTPLEVSDKTSILVGGWNKLSSRFGSLTAVLYPIVYRKETYIHVKILRSNDRPTVQKFLYILSKLMSYYNETLGDEIGYFRHMNPEFTITESKEEKVSTKENSLPILEPQIFTKKVWSRSCQKKNKPPVILDDITGKDPDTLLKFPENDITIEGTFFPSQYYHCYDDEYRYPGFIYMKSLEDRGQHPFGGYAPCCYKEDHSEKNKSILSKIHALTLQNTDPDEVVDIVFIKKNEISSDNIINYMGQQGKLSDHIKQFLVSINPENDYVRIGLSSIWQRSSLIGCCQYIFQRSKLQLIDVLVDKSDRTAAEDELIALRSYHEKMPLQKNLRNLFVQSSMDLIAQENQNTHAILQNILNSRCRLDVRHLLSLVQYYYKINLLVIDVEGNFVKPDSMFSFKIRQYDNAPLILLLEHPNNVYEIIARKSETGINYTMLTNVSENTTECKEWNFIYNVAYSTFECNDFEDATYDAMQTFFIEKKLTRQIEYQIVTGNGQTRIFLCNFKDRLLPIYLETATAPCNLPTRDSVSLQGIDEELVISFLTTISPLKFRVLKKEPFTFFLVEGLFQIPCRIGQRTKFLNVEYKESKEFPPTTAFLYKFLLPRKHDFDVIFKLKHASLLIMDYLIICFSNFMSVNHPKELVKKMISIDVDVLLQSFLETTIEFHSEKTFHEALFQPLFEENPSLYHDNKIQVPRLLEKKIFFMLKWNIVNNWEFIKSQRKHQELPSYYQHIFQFQKQKNQTIQMKREKYPIHGYQTYFETMESIVHRRLETIYFLLNRETMAIFPCFVMTRNKEKIHQVMNRYFEEGRLSFQDLLEESSHPKFRFFETSSKQIPQQIEQDEYYIFSVDRHYVVLFPFLT